MHDVCHSLNGSPRQLTMTVSLKGTFVHHSSQALKGKSPKFTLIVPCTNSTYVPLKTHKADRV